MSVFRLFSERLKTAFLAWLLGVSVAVGAAAEITGRVLEVIDGDTLRIEVEGQPSFRVRIDAIDAPELAQPFGGAAKQRLMRLAAGRDVEIETDGRDGYGRTIGRVTVNGRDVAEDLVAAGLAWYFAEQNHSRRSERLKRLEQQARFERRGLWRNKAPVPPWRFRAGMR